MAIFRPREAISWLEWYAHYSDLPFDHWQAQRREYLTRREALIRKYKILCSSITVSTEQK